MRGSAGHARLLRRACAAVVVVGTLALAALVLRPGASGGGTEQTGPLARHGGPFSLLLTALVFGGISAVRRYRSAALYEEPPTPAAERLRQATLVLLPLAAALLPVALVWWYLTGSDPSGSGIDDLHPAGPTDEFGRPTATITAVPRVPRGTTHPPTWIHGVGMGVAVVVALALLALGVVLAARYWSRYRPKHGPAVIPTAPPEAALAVAVGSGRAALHGTDARAAVIRCYAAMEASLADSGVDRLPSDSPSDLLRRAADKGVLPGEAAGTLTALFREARYSTHPMDEGHLRLAAEALDTIAGQLAATSAEEARG